MHFQQVPHCPLQGVQPWAPRGHLSGQEASWRSRSPPVRAPVGFQASMFWWWWWWPSAAGFSAGSSPSWKAIRMTRAPISAHLCWGSQPLSLLTEKFPDREADSPVVSADGKTCLGRSPLVTGLASRELRGKGQSSWAARVAPLPTVAPLTVQGHSSVRAQRSQTQHRPLPVQCGGWTAGLAWAPLLWRTDALCLSELNDCVEVCSL